MYTWFEIWSSNSLFEIWTKLKDTREFDGFLEDKFDEDIGENTHQWKNQ